MAGEIVLDAAFHKSAIYTTGKPQLLYTLIEVHPGQQVAGARVPLNFCLVLDKSASMRGDAIAYLREAVYHVIDQMASDDILSIVAFDQSARVIVPAQRVLEKEGIRRMVNRIDAGGGTQMSAGMRLGLGELDKHAGPDRLSRMVLFTDGRTSSEKGCLNRADEAAERGIPVISLGLGTEWKEELMQDIAARTGGHVDYIDRPQEILDIFDQVWRGVQVVASDLYLTVRLVAGVEVRAIWQMMPQIAHLGYEPISGRAVALSLPELEPGGQSLVLELIAPSRPVGRYRLAQAEVAYDVPGLDIRGERVRVDLVADYTANPETARRFDHHVMQSIERLSAYRLQYRAMEDLARGDVSSATQRLRAAATRLLDLGEQDLAQAAQQEADNLEHQGQMSDGGTRKLRYGTRKLTRKPGA
jgi:Ca-activated chloride channel family protein